MSYELEIREAEQRILHEAAQRAGVETIAARIAHAVRAGLRSGHYHLDTDGFVTRASTSTMETPYDELFQPGGAK